MRIVLSSPHVATARPLGDQAAHHTLPLCPLSVWISFKVAIGGRKTKMNLWGKFVNRIRVSADLGEQLILGGQGFGGGFEIEGIVRGFTGK